MVTERRISFVIGLSAYLVYSGQASFADLWHSVTIYGNKRKGYLRLLRSNISYEEV